MLRNLTTQKGFASLLRSTALVALVLFSSAFSQQKLNNPWQNIQESAISLTQQRQIIPQVYRTVTVNLEMLQQILALAPMEKENAFAKSNVSLVLPLPDGSNQLFYVTESPIMAPELAAQFPELKTYTIQAKSGVGSGRIDLTPLGFHAMFFVDGDVVFIDPYQKGDVQNYSVYFKKDFKKASLSTTDFGSCVVDHPEVTAQIHDIINSTDKQITTGEKLRTYRLALACTGEYAAYYGGTVAGATNGMVVTMNRVNAVYEKEVAIRMVMVANNSLLVYTNASTDPYTNTDGATMLSQNQTTCDSKIGTANYDIGHVFSTGGGGIADLGCVCQASYKAEGVTGSDAPVGDAYDIDYVAHEMGHQFGGNHSFNGSTGSCSGGNRNSTTAYEPGSGTTIMAYAGICSPQDLQAHSDPYFHLVNLNEIVAYTNYGSGNGCAVQTSTGNLPPTVTVTGSGVTIPYKTPFALTASGSDPNGDAITYCWEEWDLGSAGAPGTPSGTAPIFRSFNPTTSPTRIFPKVTDLLANTTTIGELLPTYARALNFRVTVRDNKAGGGGFNYASFNTTVVATAGPFVVNSPNTNVSWPGGSTQTVTWAVANTNVSPVNCANVRISLSTDGGNTWPYVLAESTPNDGSQDVTLPSLTSTTARIKVEAVGNIFFDISNVNFKLDTPVPVELSSFSANATTTGVQLSWSTATETNNFGFNVERSTDALQYQTVGFVAGHGTTTLKQNYSYTDNGVDKGKYIYRLKQVDVDGQYKYSGAIEVNVDIPRNFALEQNYPNPFNPSTTIEFSVSKTANVSLVVFDVLGRKVADIVNDVREAGSHKVSFNASTLSSGMYYYKLTAKDAQTGVEIYSATKKMALLK